MSFAHPILRCRIALLCALSILSAVSTHAVAFGQRRDPGERYAVLVGVSQYFKSELRNPPNAENDMVALADALRKSGYAKENILVMSQKMGAVDINLLPTAANIQVTLNLWLQKCTANDRILIAFAGHGVQYDGDKDCYLCPADTRLDQDRSALISVNELFQQLQKCPAKQKLLLVDACRPGAVVANPARRAIRSWNPRYRMNIRPAAGVAALFSCSEGEAAYERNDKSRSVFFHAVEDGLKGKADYDKDKVIDIAELALYANKEIGNYALLAHRKSQTPMFVSDIRDDFPIAIEPEPETTVIAERLANTDGFDAKQKQSYHKRHYVKLARGETYVINLTSEAFDTYLRLEDESGNQLDYDDDGGVGLNSRLTFQPRKSATYRVVATSYRDKVTGAYQLVITPKVQTLATNSGVVLAVNRVLTSFDRLDVVKTKSYSQEHSVRLEEGKYYTLETHSSQIDTYMRLRDPNGRTLKYDDDSGIGLNSLITYQPRNTGTYRLVVTTFRARQTGSYRLSVLEGRARYDAANERMKKDNTARADVDAGWNFISNKRYSSAISKADAVLRKYPTNASAYRLKGRAYYLQGNLTLALPQFNEAIRLEPNNCLAYNSRGHVYFDKRSYRQAIADYSTAIRLDPESAAFYANRGNAYERNGQDLAAMADARKALSLTPNYKFAKDLKRILDTKRRYGNQTGVVEFKNLSNRSVKYVIRWKDYRNNWSDWKLWTVTANGRFWNWMKGATGCELRFDTDGGAGFVPKTYTLKFYRYPSSRKVQQGMGRPYRFHWVGKERWISEPN